MNRLEGKTAIVTGAAQGLGKAFAERLIDEGCNVAVTDQQEEIEQVGKGIGAIAFCGDVGNSHHVQTVAHSTLDEFGTCADWELAGGWTTVDGERVKDDGILEKFDVSLEEAQDLVMTARVMLGWVNPDDLVPSNEDIEE